MNIIETPILINNSVTFSGKPIESEELFNQMVEGL